MAKDGEVAYPFQPYHCAEALILWARRLGQVASTMIEAFFRYRYTSTHYPSRHTSPLHLF